MLSMLVAINIPCLIFKERENIVYNTKHLKLIIFDSTYKILLILMTQSALQKIISPNVPREKILNP